MSEEAKRRTVARMAAEVMAKVRSGEIVQPPTKVPDAIGSKWPAAKKGKPYWTREDGKVWLHFTTGTGSASNHYVVAFNEGDRFACVLVFFWHGKTAPLVKGMMGVERIVNDELEKLCLEAHLEIEKFQAAAKLKMGVDLGHVKPEDVDPGYPRI